MILIKKLFKNEHWLFGLESSTKKMYCQYRLCVTPIFYSANIDKKDCVTTNINSYLIKGIPIHSIQALGIDSCILGTTNVFTTLMTLTASGALSDLMIVEIGPSTQNRYWYT